MDFWRLQGWLYDSIFTIVPHRRLVEGVAKSLPYNSLVLDAGCGTGRLAKYSSADIVSVDASSTMLKRAAQRTGKVIQANLNHTLPFQDNTFDEVASINVLYCLTDPRGSLAELHRVVKSGGKLRIASPVNRRLLPLAVEHLHTASIKQHLLTLANLPRLIAWMFNLAIRNLFDNSQFSFYPEDELVELVQGAGFIIESVKPCYSGIDRMIVAVKE